MNWQRLEAEVYQLRANLAQEIATNKRLRAELAELRKPRLLPQTITGTSDQIVIYGDPIYMPPCS